MAWAYLFIAGILEIGWAVGLQQTAGFTRLVPSVLTVGAMGVSLFFLGLSMKEIPLGLAYAVWTSIGITGTAIAGMVLYGDQLSLARVVCLAAIIGGVAGLKLLSAD